VRVDSSVGDMGGWGSSQRRRDQLRASGVTASNWIWFLQTYRSFLWHGLKLTTVVQRATLAGHKVVPETECTGHRLFLLLHKIAFSV